MQNVWKSISHAEPIQVAETIRRNSLDIAGLCGFDLLQENPHGMWLDAMLNNWQDMTLLAHRGSYKTTCVAIAMAVMMVTNPNSNMIFMRKTDADVAEIIRQVKKILQSDVMSYLSSLIHGKELALNKDGQNELNTNLRTSNRGTSQLLGIGIGGSITGKHADTIFTDDIVNVSDRHSRAERERTKTIYQELQNVRNRGGRIINTGTPWHVEDAISIMPNVQRFDCYQTGLIAPDKLEELRQSMSPSLFSANYELRHIAAEDALFKSAPQFFSDASILRDGISHVDAAYGGGDYTAYTAAKRVGDTIYMYGKMYDRHVDTCMEAIVDASKRLMCEPIYCETNGDKGYLGRELRRKTATVQMYQEKMNKYAKISTFLVKWWGKIKWLEGTDKAYLAQIQNYTQDAEHDDAPDSAACICRILDRKESSDIVWG